MQTYDCIIVGGGIAGASAGFEIAAFGKVLLLERETQLGYHSTGRSAAVFLKSHGPAPIRALASCSKAFLLNPPGNFADFPLLTPRGMLFVGRPEDSAQLDHAAAECARYVAGVRRLNAAEVRGLIPVIRADYLGGAVLDPEAMDIDVHGVHYGFIRGLRSRGGTILTDAEVLEAQHDHGLWTITTAQGRYTAPTIVNAAGAWCDRIAALAGARAVGLVPKRRTAFVFAPPANLHIDKWPVVHDIGETFYFKPDAGKLLASPADETPMEPHDVHPDDIDVAAAIERIQRCADLPVTHIDRKWAGLRSFVADGCPVVGFDPQVAGFFWLAGQGGYGIETSPAMARLSAGLLNGRGVPDDLARLGVTAEAVSPNRCARP